MSAGPPKAPDPVASVGPIRPRPALVTAKSETEKRGEKVERVWVRKWNVFILKRKYVKLFEAHQQKTAASRENLTSISKLNREDGDCSQLPPGTWERVRLGYVQRVGVEKSQYAHSIRRQNQLHFTQHNTHCKVRWHSGESIKDKRQPLPRNLQVLSAWLRSSSSIQKQMLTFRTITLQILRLMSQRSWRRIRLCGQHQGAYTEQMDM